MWFKKEEKKRNALDVLRMLQSRPVWVWCCRKWPVALWQDSKYLSGRLTTAWDLDCASTVPEKKCKKKVQKLIVLMSLTVVYLVEKLVIGCWLHSCKRIFHLFFFFVLFPNDISQKTNFVFSEWHLTWTRSNGTCGMNGLWKWKKKLSIVKS